MFSLGSLIHVGFFFNDRSGFLLLRQELTQTKRNKHPLSGYENFSFLSGSLRNRIVFVQACLPLHAHDDPVPAGGGKPQQGSGQGGAGETSQ